MTFSLAQLRYRLSTPYLANGFTVAAGVALIVGLAGLLLPPIMAAMLVTGLIPTTIGDAPAPLRRKPAELLMSAGATIACITLTCFASLQPILTAIVVAGVGLLAGMVVAFGRRGVPLSVTLLFSTILVLGSPPHDLGAAAEQSLLAAIGAFAYLPWGILAARWLERWNRRLVLIDAMRALEAFIRTKAELYDESIPLAGATNKMITVQAAMAERFQNARETLFDAARREDGFAEALVVLIDISETALAAHTDHRQMRAALWEDGLPVAPRISLIIGEIADALDEISRHLLLRESFDPDFSMRGRLGAYLGAHRRGEEAALAEIRSAVETTARKLIHVVEDLERLSDILRHRADEPPLPRGDLAAFQRYPEYELALLRRHLTWSSPIARHALRLSLALTSVYVATHLLSVSSHANWILLSVAVVLRPAYGLSRQRVKDRIIGNSIGCALAALLIHFAPAGVQYTAMFVALALAQAYAPIKYVVAVTGGSVLVLVQQHLLTPSTDFIFIERIYDTIIGTLLAFAFARLLPFWEARTLPAARIRLREAMRRFLEIGLSREPVSQPYRLARREFVEALGALASLSQRIENEPQKGGYDQQQTMNLLASGFLLLANILSMRLFLTRSEQPTHIGSADAALASLRRRVHIALSAPASAEATAPALTTEGLPGDLARRLTRIDEETAYVSSLVKDPMKTRI